MYKKVSKKCAKTTTISYCKNKIYHVVQKQYETFNVQVKKMQGQKNKVAI